MSNKQPFSLARLSVDNPVLVNLVMVTIIVLGALSLIALPREMMPEIDMQWAFIVKPYPGVPPAEIEKLITKPIEDEIQDVQGIDFVASQSSEGAAFISVKFKQLSDEEFRLRFQDLRAEVDKVQGLPEDALDTECSSFSTSDMIPAISVHLHGQLPPKKLMELGKQLKEELLEIPHISKVQLTGVRDREFWVEASPDLLKGQNLTLDQLKTAIAIQGLNIPGGRLSSGRKEMFVRTVGEYTNQDDIKKVIVRTTEAGQTIRVGDVATIKEDFEDERTRSRLNNDPAVTLTITKKPAGNAIDIIAKVKQISDKFAKRQGNKVSLSYTQDSSEQIEDILAKLSRNALFGFGTVVIVLLIVLGFRNALLSALGIPISFFICFIFMYQMEESFNGSSLFALVLVLGIVVDDAIIVIENCYRHRQMGKSWREAAIEGAQEVTTPVFSAIATTIAAFLPLMLMPGIMGKFLRIVPVVVSLCLVASLFEALFILPSHFADWPGRKKTRKIRPTPKWLLSLQNSYTRGLTFVVKYRYAFVLPLVFIVLPATGALIPHLGVNMFAGEEVPTFQVRIKMPVGTNLETTSQTLQLFEKKAGEIAKNEVRAIHSTAGLVMTDTDWVFKTNVAQIWLDLVPSYERNRTTDEIMADLRNKLMDIPGPIDIELAKINNGPPVGKPVEFKVKGKYFDEIKAVADDLKAEIKKAEGTMEIGDNFDAGKEEARITINPELAALHALSVAQVGMAIRNAIDGTVAETMYDGDEEIDIVVRMDMRNYPTPQDLLRLPLTTPKGASITLGDISELKIKQTRGQIRRYKGQREITVFSNLDTKKNTALAVQEKILQRFDKIKAHYPNVTLDFSGELKEFQDTFSGLIQLFAFGMLLIYAILGTQFRSYIQPIVIFFTVPFAFIGAAIGLLISGNPFSLITMYGIVALAGVAVNDAIVLITFINKAKADGMPGKKAVVEGGRLRLRPILLTSLTTIAGLIPMALGIGGVSLTWSPMANTIAWGLGVGTILTLFMIPAVYCIIVEDIAGSISKKPAKILMKTNTSQGESPSNKPAEPTEAQ